MKPLLVSTVAIATSLFILCTSFHLAPTNVSSASAPANVSSTPVNVSPTPATNEGAGPLARTGNLFWYIDNGTVYHDWTSISNEVIELETEYGVLVDGNPSGGTLLSSGYAIYGYPHLVFASSLLYGHF